MTRPVVVWFKRDLRVVDHAPLRRAMENGPILPLYVIEPDYWQQPYASGRQWQFLKDSLLALDQALTQLGQPLWIAKGPIEQALDRLHSRFNFAQIWSHQETGPDWTFQRDRLVKDWCQSHGVRWQECRQHGVIRGLAGRRKWATQWQALMDAPRVDAPERVIGVGRPDTPAARCLDESPVDSEPLIKVQPGGLEEGMKLLNSFLIERGRTYRGGMSSPLTAEHVCSRLSAHFSVGAVSLRSAWQASEAARLAYKENAMDARFAASLKSFGSRLHWHCHFMQKLESEPRLEWEPLHRGFIGLRDQTPDRAERLERLALGQTGWPFVDACLRSLAQTGWLNFRMRAMLVAIASYHLWLDWVDTAPIFARWFTDFEAGIHFSQMQMQSGTTGINANRIYNPIKQSEDQDPDGQFIRRWLPELEAVPAPWIHQPWKLPESKQRAFKCVVGVDYPEPVGDPVQLAREARARLKAWMVERDLKPEAMRVLTAHGSQLRQKRPRYGKKATSSQLQLEL